MNKRIIKKALATGAAALAGTFTAKLVTRKIIDKTHDRAVKILMEDLYDENIWELITSTGRIGVQTVIETNLRATEGKTINRPMGSPKKFTGLDSLMFSIAQMHIMPTEYDTEIDTKVTIGKQAKKPFSIDFPVILAPMAYGVALSEKAKIALAQGATKAGTATNTGEGPFLSSERKHAKQLIYQYNRGDWGKTPEIIGQCDAVEIQIGQGALAGLGHVLKANKLDKELRDAYKYPKGKDVVAHSRQPEVPNPKHLEKLVHKLKNIGEGIPVGIKMAAGKHLEADLEWVCNAGIDYIVMEGAEAASKSSAPILQDDFGVPLLFAISRTVDWLEKKNFKNQVSLIASGKIRTPGDMLKVCALGADACYIGAIALFALTHNQALKALPFEPPTQVVWYEGHFSKKLNVSEAADALYNFLTACKQEIADGIKALGKTSLQEVNRSDLMSLNELVTKATGIPMVYEPFIY